LDDVRRAPRQTAAGIPQVTPRSRRSSRSPTASRHGHVTVCCWTVLRRTVNCWFHSRGLPW